jgi:hypothetical protein
MQEGLQIVCQILAGQSCVDFSGGSTGSSLADPELRALVRRSILRVNAIACSLSSRSLFLLTSLLPIIFLFSVTFVRGFHATILGARCANTSIPNACSFQYITHVVAMSGADNVYRIAAAIPIPCRRKLGRETFQPSDKTSSEQLVKVWRRHRDRPLERPRIV